MSRDWKFFVYDILESIQRIESYCKDYSFEKFPKDTKTQDAVIKNLINIGEAVNKIPVTIQNKYQEIPLKEISGLRNRLVHAYFVIDLSIIWNIIQNEIPELKIIFEKIKEDKE